MRTIAAVLLISLAAGVTPALAERPGESDNGRFTFKEVPEGILRLDGRTGQVSLCSRITEWACSNEKIHDPRHPRGESRPPINQPHRIRRTRTQAGRLRCDSCHGAPPAAPHPQRTDCNVCHSGTVKPDGTNLDGFTSTLSTALATASNNTWSILTAITGQGLFVIDPGFRWVNAIRDTSASGQTASNITVVFNQAF